MVADRGRPSQCNGSSALLSSPLTFWQNIPSIHQAPLIRAVAEKWPESVTVVTEKDVSRNRLSSGWAKPEFTPARLVVAPDTRHRWELLDEGGEDGIHIFSGFHAYPTVYHVFRRAMALRLSVGVFAEPGRVGGLKGLMRQSRYVMQALRWGDRLDFLLATGETGVRYYRESGFPRERIHPFAYFVENDAPKGIEAISPGSTREMDSSQSLLFVGELIHRKGLDVLLSSLGKVQDKCWILNVVGQGPERERLERASQGHGIADRVRWKGSLPNFRVRSLMEEADCLVLPSRYDGWGAVVNEALMAGTPVIVSGACGSSDLVRAPWIGDIFPSESAQVLAEVLRRRMEQGRVTSAERSRIRNWAQEAIAPTRGADYLLNIIDFVQAGRVGIPPEAPWRGGG